MSNIVDPSEACRTRALNTRKSHLDVNTVDEISISGNGASEFLTEIGITIEDLLNGFNCKVGVSTIDNLEDE